MSKPGHDEVVLALANGFSLRSGSEKFAAGDYVRLCDETGEEVLYWDHTEWRDDPELVMGAIINAAVNRGKVPGMSRCAKCRTLLPERKMAVTADGKSVCDGCREADGEPQRRTVEFEDIVLVDGDVRVTIEWIGEGRDGDFDPDDPNDVPLLRFSVDRKCGEEWEEVPDCSYCTQMCATDERARLQDLAKRIMAEVKDTVNSGRSPKRTCERLSWLPLDVWKYRDYEEVAK